MIEKNGILVAVGLDDTVVDTETAFREMAARFGAEIPDIVEERRPDDEGRAQAWDKALEEADELRDKAIRRGLYLRADPLPHAVETLRQMNDGHPDWHILLTDQRDGRSNGRDVTRGDTDRWLTEYGLNDSNLDLTARDGMSAYSHMCEIRKLATCGEWGWENGIAHLHVIRPADLKADLYIESDPYECGRLMELGMRVLMRRTPRNGAQCDLAASNPCAAVFDDWREVPRLAERLLTGRPATFDQIRKPMLDYLDALPYATWDMDRNVLRVGMHELLAYMESTNRLPVCFYDPVLEGDRRDGKDEWRLEHRPDPVPVKTAAEQLNLCHRVNPCCDEPLWTVIHMPAVLDVGGRVEWVPLLCV